MAIFYTVSDEPLLRVTDLNFRGGMITSPKLQQRRYMQPSPLSVITKFILSELEKPVMAKESIVKRIKDCKIENAKNKYVRKELYKTLDPASHTKI